MWARESYPESKGRKARRLPDDGISKEAYGHDSHSWFGAERSTWAIVLCGTASAPFFRRSRAFFGYNGPRSAEDLPKGVSMSRSRITRRDALFVLGAAAVPLARAEAGLLRATRVDHVALSVGDIDKAMMFYRRLFGDDVLKDSKTPRRYLRLGPCYMAIAPAPAGEAKRIDHFGIGVETFNAPSMKSALEKAGFKVRESNVGLFVTDPD